MLSDYLSDRRNPIVIDAHCHLSSGRGGIELTAKTMIDKMDEAGVDTIISMGGGRELSQAAQ